MTSLIMDGVMKSESKSTSASDHMLSSAHVMMSEKGFSGVGLTKFLKVSQSPEGVLLPLLCVKRGVGDGPAGTVLRSLSADMDDIFAERTSQGQSVS